MAVQVHWSLYMARRTLQTPSRVKAFLFIFTTLRDRSYSHPAATGKRRVESSAWPWHCVRSTKWWQLASGTKLIGTWNWQVLHKGYQNTNRDGFCSLPVIMEKLVGYISATNCSANFGPLCAGRALETLQRSQMGRSWLALLVVFSAWCVLIKRSNNYFSHDD